MTTHDYLCLRMKTFYEQIPKTRLMRRVPVAIRIDGKAFHTFTRGFQKPFDEILIVSMQQTMKYLCENIQGCVLGYTQSDEITLILIDYKKLTSAAWFDYEVQKMCSIAASMATMAFNRFFAQNTRLERYHWDQVIDHWYHGFYFDDTLTAEEKKKIIDRNNNEFEKGCPQLEFHEKALEKGAMFDARCFNIPKEEVCNLIYWRQLDAARNSIQMVGQANFYHKELQNKSCNDIQDMLMTQKGINWNDFPTHQKRGSCCIKTEQSVTEETTVTENQFGEDKEKHVINVERPHWIIDNEIPLFKGEGRDYIDKLIYV